MNIKNHEPCIVGPVKVLSKNYACISATMLMRGDDNGQQASNCATAERVVELLVVEE